MSGLINITFLLIKLTFLKYNGSSLWGYFLHMANNLRAPEI